MQRIGFSVLLSRGRRSAFAQTVAITGATDPDSQPPIDNATLVIDDGKHRR